MHVKSKKVFSAFDQIARYIDDCDSFCVEIDLELSQSPQMQKVLLLPFDTPLSSLLKPKQTKRLEQIMESLGGPSLQQVQFLRPMNLINLLSSLIMKEDTNTILDMSLYQNAKNNGKRVFGIETLEEHLQILDKLDLETELKQLKVIIRNFPAFVRQHHKIMGYYINGKIDKLYLHGKKSLGKWRKTLLMDRNIKMSARLYNLASTESVFCAVGAGHLFGKEGILCLLKHHGATLKPIHLIYS